MGDIEPKVTPKAVKRNRSQNDEEAIEVASAIHRRTSNRRSHRLVLHRSSLYYRRVEQLFFASAFPVQARENGVKLGKLVLRQIYSEPRIYTVDNFLSASDLLHLREKISKGRFQRSYVDFISQDAASLSASGDAVDASVQSAKGKTVVNEHRTSSFLSFDKQEDSRIAAIEKRAAELMGCWSTQPVEPLQLVRYTPGQFFNVHHDLGDYDDETGVVELPPKSLFSKRRLITIFCYLNEVEKGGETSFPSCPLPSPKEEEGKTGEERVLKIRPHPGRAVVWSNVLANGQPDARTVHAGLPVERGVKYGLNIWITEN